MKNIHVVIVLFVSVNLTAQTDSVKTSELKHNLGVAAGFTTGVGPSYRYKPNRNGIQITFMPIVDRDETRIWTGLTYLRQVSRDFNHMSGLTSNIFYYLSGFHRYEEKYYYDYYYNSDSNRDYTYEHLFNVGTGLGYEIIAINHLSFNIMIGYASMNNFEIVSPTIESGLYFKL